jgi:hypothetical protein
MYSVLKCDSFETEGSRGRRREYQGTHYRSYPPATSCRHNPSMSHRRACGCGVAATLLTRMSASTNRFIGGRFLVQARRTVYLPRRAGACDSGLLYVTNDVEPTSRSTSSRANGMIPLDPPVKR